MGEQAMMNGGFRITEHLFLLVRFWCVVVAIEIVYALVVRYIIAIVCVIWIDWLCMMFFWMKSSSILVRIIHDWFGVVRMMFIHVWVFLMVHSRVLD